MPVNDIDCSGAGEQPPEFDVENTILCDKLDDGTVVGTAILRYTYDESTGLPVGPPEPFIVGTNDPYTIQGTLTPCEQCNMAEPQTFYFTSSSTGPVDFPGREYDGTLNISRGYSVDQLSIGGTNYPVALTWSILDTEGIEFAEALQQAIQSRIPGSTVTVTPPPIDRCDTSNRPFQIHIDCIDADRAPTDVTLRYDSGTDLVTNPAQLDENGEPAVAPGGLGFQLRQDDDGTYQPQAPHTLDCTSVDGEGWYLTPQARFETWGAGFLNTTPTPRGGSIIELNTTTGTPEWLHQKVTVPADGQYTLRAFLGGRAADVSWNLRLSTGDTGSTGGGDVANITQITPPVGDTANPQPWSRLEQTALNLTAGVYTLSMSGTGGGGALYTDLRLFTTSAGTITSLVANDECVNTREVTTNTVACEQWQPIADGNCDIVSWRNIESKEIVTDDAFWSQVPAPVGCYIAPEGEDPEVTFGNLATTYSVCGNGETFQRTVLTDNSGAPVSETWVTANGAVAAPPPNYTVGPCPAANGDVEIQETCVNGVTIFREVLYRNGVQIAVRWIGVDGAEVTPAPTAWFPGACTPEMGDDIEETVVCAVVDFGGPQTGETQTLRRVVRETDGTETITYSSNGIDITANVISFTPGPCDYQRIVLCDANGDSFIQRHGPASGGNQDGVEYFTLQGAPIIPDPVGPYSVCGPVEGPDFESHLVCADGTTLVQVVGYNADDTIASVRYFDGTTVVAEPAAWVYGQCEAIIGDDVEELAICATVDLGGGNVFTVPALRRVVREPDDTETVTYISGSGGDITAALVGWTPGECETPQRLVLCDVNGDPFIQRHGQATQANPSGIQYFTLQGALMQTDPTGPYQVCGANDPQLDVEEFILCDENGAFRRRSVFNADGTLASQNDFTVDGAPYVVGTIEPCAAAPNDDNELSEIVVCSIINGIPQTAIRRIETTNGAIIAETFIGANGAVIVPDTWTPGPCDPAPNPDEIVATGIRRTVGTAGQNLKTEFPGLQSVTLTVITGTVNVTMTNGATVPVPAGISLSWSVTDDDDSSLDVALFNGATAQADYLLNFTMKATVEG